MPNHPIKGDARYTVALEYCGYSKPRHVARWCGEWLGQDETQSGAVMLCVAHMDKRHCPHCDKPNCEVNHMAINSGVKA
jgi:hypothetical protein